jgi:hypothetical protein
MGERWACDQDAAQTDVDAIIAALIVTPDLATARNPKAPDVSVNVSTDVFIYDMRDLDFRSHRCLRNRYVEFNMLGSGITP